MDNLKGSVQLQFPLEFHLKKVSDKFLEDVKKINLVHPQDTLGAYLTPVGHSRDRLSINIPRLNTIVKFSVSDDVDTIEKFIRFFNVAASFRSCILLSNVEGTTLTVNFIVASSEKSQIVQAFYNELLK